MRLATLRVELHSMLALLLRDEEHLRLKILSRMLQTL
jgi:hypothetical protein